MEFPYPLTTLLPINRVQHQAGLAYHYRAGLACIARYRARLGVTHDDHALGKGPCRWRARNPIDDRLYRQAGTSLARLQRNLPGQKTYEYLLLVQAGASRRCYLDHPPSLLVFGATPCRCDKTKAARLTHD